MVNVADAAADRKRQQHGKQILEHLDPQTIESICQKHGHRWREGKLPPAQTIHAFAWQVLMGNVSCQCVRHHAQGDFTAAAYCMARQRLPLAVLKELGQRIASQAMAQVQVRGDACWKGKRVFILDGSSTSLCDSTALRRHFGCSGRQKPGCGYPTAHVLLLSGPGGVAVEAICSPLRTADMTHASKLHGHLQEGDLCLGDRQFAGWGHLYQLQSQKLDGIFPAHRSRHIYWGKHVEHGTTRRWIRSLGYYDQLVQYKKPAACPPWMSPRDFKAAPQWITVREIRRSIAVGGMRRQITLVSTLTDACQYPAQAIVKLLSQRWTIELHLRSLKSSMGMAKLCCQSVQGVCKELAMYLIVYNLVRLRMLQAAAGQKVPLERISFADALASVRYGGTEPINLLLLPQRPGRVEPRVVKRRPNSFERMRQPRTILRRRLMKRKQRKLA